MQHKNINIIVFDLDETLGHFVQLGIFCDILEKYYNKKLTINEFNEIMNIFPEFIRPNILKILLYLKKKKQKNDCKKIIIYTNNQGPKEWAEKIVQFFDQKLNYKLFDQIIGAYKVNNIIIEPSRTSHNKTVNDLLESANIPKNANICFIDDLYHPLMDNDKIYYINVDPYIYTIPFDVMAERYYKEILKKIDEINEIDKSVFIKFIVKNSKEYDFDVKKKSISAMNNDKENGKEILSYLHDFFKINKQKKTKRLKKKINFTRKN